MFFNVVVGLKEGLPAGELMELVKKVAGKNAKVQLASFVKVGPHEDEPLRLRNMERELERLAVPLRADGYEVTPHVGLIAVAAAGELLRFASERDADLLVIGLAKRTRVGKALMGSDAQRVILGAGCPVLVTRMYE